MSPRAAGALRAGPACRANYQSKLPVVLSAVEVRRLLAAVSALDHRVCLSLIYSCGLRLGEGLGLQVGDIDSQRRLLHIRAGKGNRDRYVPLPHRTLALLREQWKAHRHPAWIFPAKGHSGQGAPTATRPMTRTTLQRAFRLALQASGVKKDAHVHTLRHSYHPHIHYLVPGGGLSPDGRQWIAARPRFLFPVKALGAQCRTLFKTRLYQKHPDLFAQVPAKVWRRHWNVDSRAAGSGENALRYLSRYVFKTATSNRQIQLLPEGQVRWSYRESNTGRPASIRLQPLEFMARFLQHVLPRGFARVRTFGWLHPAAKVRGNRVRALLRQLPVLTPAEQQVWQPAPEPQVELPANPTLGVCSAPLCPRCQKPMRLVGSWRPGPVVLYPKRPP